MAVDTSTNAQIKSYLEEITHTQNDASFPGSLYEQQIVNKGYLKTAYRYSWPQTMKRFADVVVANVDRYSLQSDFHKFGFMVQQAMPLDPTDVEHVRKSFNEYATALDSNEYILANLPTTASTQFTFSGSYSAGNAVVITLASVTGISAGDEVFILDGVSNSEFTRVQSVDGTGITITVKLRLSHSNVSLYRIDELNYFNYQKQVTPLSGSTDTPVTPGETHLSIPHYAAYLYYKDIEEPDRAATHMQTWEDEVDEAWLTWGKTEAGAVGEMTL